MTYPIPVPAGRVRHFARHYIEMVVAMFVGMAVLGLPAGWIADYDVPAQMVTAMAVTMTLPMAGWMRHRGHGWQPIAEMSMALAAADDKASTAVAKAILVKFIGSLLREFEASFP